MDKPFEDIKSQKGYNRTKKKNHQNIQTSYYSANKWYYDWISGRCNRNWRKKRNTVQSNPALPGGGGGGGESRIFGVHH